MIYDPATALEAQRQNNSGRNPLTLQTLQDVLWDSHPYAAIYRHAHELLLQDGSVECSIKLHCIGDKRRYNLPIANKVAVIIPGNKDAKATSPHNIILHRRTDTGALQSLYDGHPAYACLHYVLLFPTGQHGWHWGLHLCDPSPKAISGVELEVLSAKEQDDNARNEGGGEGDEGDEGEGKGRLTQTRFYAYRLHPRRNEFSTILHARKLLQQYIVDAWASSDQTQLNWFRMNQSTIQASLYSGLQDVTASADASLDLNSIGRCTILPSSYIRGARHMHRIFQDSMAIARYFKKFDLFITMTANPHWPEVQRELFPGQDPSDRPNIITRVFWLKKDALLHDIMKNGIFGRPVAKIYTIEFQKRGLPHIHLLIFLEEEHKLSSIDAVDSCIRAYWPDPKTEPQLFEIVKQVMVHGPCGSKNPRAPCNNEKNRCTKKYPRLFQDGTTMDEEGYPVYHRPNDGREYVVRDTKVHNGSIVPHNPYLSVKYQCHINVECAVRYASTRSLLPFYRFTEWQFRFASVKYIHKYIFKGHDRTSLEVEGHDEIREHIDGRFLGASEGTWRIFHFNMHSESPNVVRLEVHLPGQHLVHFDPDDDPATVMERASNKTTKLTGFFKVNSDTGRLGEVARQLTYQEFPQKLVWKKKGWAVRKKGFAIGRMYFASPTSGERQ